MVIYNKFINYYNTNTQTVLNQEVYDSIEDIATNPNNRFNPFQDITVYNTNNYINLYRLYNILTYALF